jgi:hypothetical protein
MKNTIEGFELVYDEGSDALLLCKDGYFLRLDINLGSKTTWANLVENDDEYYEFIGDKLKSRIKKALSESFNK